MEHLLARGQAAATGSEPVQTALTAAEAERAVQHLRPFGVVEYGTAAWLDQHDALEQLNLQAHLNTQTHSDEFVKEALVSHDRVTLLVHELLAAEVWRERLLPLLEGHLATGVDSVTAYHLLYQEATLANLLEVVLFHEEAAEAASEEALVELSDWCARALAYLGSGEAHEHAAHKERSAQELLALSPLEELRERRGEVRLAAALCAPTLLRYLTDHAPRLSLSVLARIVSTNDTAMALLPLLDRPPWVRRGRGGATEKFVGGSWQAVEARERHRLTQLDGQVWLLLHNLVADPAARSRMDMTEARANGLLRLKRHFNELLLDQLPVLRSVQRVLDELAFGMNNCQAVGTPARLIMEQVHTMRAAMLRCGDWGALAEQQRAQQFGPSARQLSQQRLESLMRGIDLMCGMDADLGRQQGELNALPDRVKVDAYRQAKLGVWEWWATYTLQLNCERPPDAVTSTPGPAAAGCGRVGGGEQGTAGNPPNENHPRQPSSGDSGLGAAAPVKGKRYRLLPLSESLQRALPADGKVAVLFGRHTCEAQLSLPASETRDTSSLPPAMWLTVGGLAGSGLALQLKLKRMDKPCERDKGLGVWYPYVPVGGALAVRDGLLEAAE